MKKTIILVALVGLFMSCKSGQNNASSSSKEMNQLVKIMQGSYSSEKQSVVDTSYFIVTDRYNEWKSSKEAEEKQRAIKGSESYFLKNIVNSKKRRRDNRSERSFGDWRSREF